MKQLRNNTFWFIVLISILVSACDNGTMLQHNAPLTEGQVSVLEKADKALVDSVKGQRFIPGQYIVIFKDRWQDVRSTEIALQVRSFTDAFLSQTDVMTDSVAARFEHVLHGFTAHIDAAKAEKLRKDARVDRVVQDRYFKAVGFNYRETSPRSYHTATLTSASQTSQTTPWGITRVGGSLDGSGKKAWILDSGIDLNHSDLNVDVLNSASFIANENADDLFGHGTYVAGILAAKNNAQGVVGVAAGATVVSVKVLDQNGFATLTSICNGLDYVVANASTNDIINMSIQSLEPVSTLDQCVADAADLGFRIVTIAGNHSEHASDSSPGRVNHFNVWTVSAYDDTDSFATAFSNYGNPPIEYGGPGVDIPSLRMGGGSGMGFIPGVTGDEDGTSYAAPHIAGLLLASPYGIDIDGTVSNDPDGDPDYIAVALLQLPLEVGIGGPHQMHYNDYEQFTAYPSGGNSPYDYQWQIDYGDGTGPWQDIGGNSALFTHIVYNPSVDHFYLRVIVTDSDNDTQTSNRHPVMVVN